MLYHWDFQAIGRLRGDAQVYPLVTNDDVAFLVVMGIALGKVFQYAHQGQPDKDKRRQFGLFAGYLCIEVLPQGFQSSDIHFLHVGEVRYLAGRLGQAFCDFTAQADDLDFCHAGECLRRRRCC